MVLRGYFKSLLVSKIILHSLFLFLMSFFGYSQDSIFNNIDNTFNESLKRQDKLYNFYTDDFLIWKNKVDLKKIKLVPEKAVVNQYKEIISNRNKVTSEINKNSFEVMLGYNFNIKVDTQVKRYKNPRFL